MSKLKMIQVGTGGWGKSWLPFLLDSPDWELAALVSRGGANLEQAEAWQPNVVIDRELITGQNPFSDKVLAEALIKQLEQAQ